MTRLQALIILLILTMIFYSVIIKYKVKKTVFIPCHGHELLKEYEKDHKMTYHIEFGPVQPQYIGEHNGIRYYDAGGYAD